MVKFRVPRLNFHFDLTEFLVSLGPVAGLVVAAAAAAAAAAITVAASHRALIFLPERTRVCVCVCVQRPANHW